MLVKYYMNSTCTYANFVADITGIVNGTITSTGGLSAGANTSLSTFTGTYPSTFYALANGGGSGAPYANTVTFLKVHNANSATNCYFTLGFNGSTGLANVTLGVGYANSTNVYATGSNTYVLPAVIGPQTYNSVDIVISNTVFYIDARSIGAYGVGVFDLAYNGVLLNFPNSMVNALIPISNAVVTPLPIVPYSYYLANSTYTASNTTNITLAYTSPATSIFSVAGNVAIIENPVFVAPSYQANALSLVYSLNALVQGEYAAKSVYSDTSSNYRYVVATDSTTWSINV